MIQTLSIRTFRDIPKVVLSLHLSMELFEPLIGPELGRDLASPGAAELSGVRRIKKNLTLLVNGGHQLHAGLLRSLLEDKLYQFEPSLGGVLMSYDDLLVMEISRPNTNNDSIQVTVRANFYVFYSAPGHFLSVRIMEKQTRLRHSRGERHLHYADQQGCGRQTQGGPADHREGPGCLLHQGRA